MKKIVLFTLVGLILCLLGIVVFYLYLMSLNDGNNFLLFILAFFMLGVAVFCFIKANKPSAPKSTDLSFSKSGSGSMLEKNNAMLGEYAKTSDARDRLKMLEAAADKDVM